ncbi:MAG: hypothetical protein U9Q79_12075, partial [Candidatus Hydrogenedentes bacterium]|nr:hypothetical protein [Candidatus Hydrogenedentota bacterium]
MNATCEICAISLLTAMILILSSVAMAAETVLLWEIGARDNDARDLALGPDRYAEFSDDPLFIIGE